MVAVIFSVITFAARAFVIPTAFQTTVFYIYKLGEVAKIGYFAMKIVSELATKLLNERYPKNQAR